MFHDICGEGAESGFQGAGPALYKITPTKFQDHLETISAESLVPPELVTDTSKTECPLFITFDDGGASAMFAADRLEEYGWRGHFLITSGRIGTTGFVSAENIRELFLRGHVVGSHSENHPLRMAGLTRGEIFEEWRVSLDRLSGILGNRIVVASVPGGFFSRIVAECAAENQIEYLFNSEPRISVNKVGICEVFGRFAVRSTTTSKQMSSLVKLDLGERLIQGALWNLKKPMKVLGGGVFLTIRSKLIGDGSGS